MRATPSRGGEGTPGPRAEGDTPRADHAGHGGPRQTPGGSSRGGRRRRWRAGHDRRAPGAGPAILGPEHSSAEDKALAAEERTSAVRGLVIVLNIVTYWAWLYPAGLGMPPLAGAISVIAACYAAYDLITRPYRRFPVLATSAWTTVTDGVLITLWLHATGDFASPYYLLWYLSLIAVAFRYAWRAPLVAAGLYSASYTALALASGPAPGAADLTIRVGYILLCGGLGALLAHESARAFEERTLLGRQAREAGRLRALAERLEAQETASVVKAQEASSRLAAVVESSIDGILTKDLSGTITSWNPASEALFGYTAAEAIGKKSTLLSPKGKEHQEERILASIRAGRPVRIREAKRVRKDGRPVWVSLSASPLRDASGRVVGCAAISRDISQARAAERERARAQEAAARLAAVVESSIDGILTKDLSGTITSWNAACESIFGYTAEEAIGQSITMLYPGDKQAEEARILSKLRRGEPVRIHEAERVRKDGSPVWVSVSASPLRDATGRVVGAAAIKRDITQVRALERERAEAKERALELARLQDINRFKTQFINTAAHELRTPLLPLRMQLDLMLTDEQDPPSAARRQAMEVMRRNLERLAALVEDLLTIARSQAGRIELEARPMDLAEALQEAAASFRAVATRQGVRLVVDAGGPVEVLADPKRVAQVLSNLLSNAFKFTPAGGEVQVTADASETDVRVAVADTGTGIAGADLARLFQPFVQVHDAAQVTQPGSGLGLYICKQIIELHGGSIGAESRGRGMGSTFWFTLPQATPPPPVAPADPAATAEGT